MKSKANQNQIKIKSNSKSNQNQSKPKSNQNPKLISREILGYPKSNRNYWKSLESLGMLGLPPFGGPWGGGHGACSPRAPRSCRVSPPWGPRDPGGGPVGGPREGGGRSNHRTMISRKSTVKNPTRKVSHEPMSGIQSASSSLYASGGL